MSVLKSCLSHWLLESLDAWHGEAHLVHVLYCSNCNCEFSRVLQWVLDVNILLRKRINLHVRHNVIDVFRSTAIVFFKHFFRPTHTSLFFE